MMTALAGICAVAAVAGAIAALRARGALGVARAETTTLRQSLDEQRRAAEARDRLLGAVVEATPVAMVLFADAGRIAFTNAAARELFFESNAVEGQNFLGLLARAPEALRRALLSDRDELFTVENEGEADTFYLAKRHFEVAGEPHTLIAVKPVTQEISQREIATLKKVIRIIGHEASNSLAPITSLMSSARTILARPEMHGKLATIFATVEERAAHLQSFLNGYTELAKLPQPKKARVAWGPFVEGLATLFPQVHFGTLPTEPGEFDQSQLQQAMINLIKNALEAGGPADQVHIEVTRAPEGGFRITVLDRGAGMTDEVMRNALMPFFTTKKAGTGLGLALCREIVDQHRGRMRLAKREGGGMAISLWLPEGAAPAMRPGPSMVRLSLTRA